MRPHYVRAIPSLHGPNTTDAQFSSRNFISRTPAPAPRLRIRLVAKRREQHEEEWCEAPDIVRLRGLVVRARKLRAYEREWGEVVVEEA